VLLSPNFGAVWQLGDGAAESLDLGR